MVIQILFLLQIITAPTYGKQILGGDIFTDFATGKKMNKFDLKFKLETPLTTTDYLLISLPFQFHYLLTASPYTKLEEDLKMPLDLYINWFELDEQTGEMIDPTQVQNFCRVFIKDETTGNYFIQFLNDQKEVVVIEDKWYKLVFSIQDNRALQLQFDSQIQIISMKSMSTTDIDKGIIYQENQVQSYFYFQNDPNENIIVDVQYLIASQQGDLGGINTVYFDCDLTYIDDSQFDDTIRIFAAINSKDFQFQIGSSCYSSSKFTIPKIDSYSQNDYKCRLFEDNLQLLEIQITKEAFLKQKKIRIASQIVNPLKIVKNVSVDIRMLKEISPYIISQGTIENALYTSYIDVTEHQIYLSWGLRPNPNLPFELYIVREDKEDPQYKPFNSFKTEFSIGNDTPQGIELKTDVLINIDEKAYVLPGSITHNFPNASNKQVICKELYRFSISKRTISCKNIGYLIKDTKYFITFQMTFPYDILELPISTDTFGSVLIYTAQKMSQSDSLYILGRQEDFLQFMMQQQTAFLIRENSEQFIQYLQNFDSIQILARAQDFQEYQNEVHLNKRPADYVNSFQGSQKSQFFDDLFVPNDPTDFLQFANQYKNKIYIFQQDVQPYMDYVKGYDFETLIDLSKPTNAQEIQTINGKNMLPKQTYQPTMVSSVPSFESYSDPFDINYPDKQLGLQSLDYAQRLMFTMNFGYNDITYLGSKAENQDFKQFFSTGINIITNPKIQPIKEYYGDILQTSLSQDEFTDTNIYHYIDQSDYNHYTHININFRNSESMKLVLPNSYNTTYNYFGVQGFLIQDFSSQYTDESTFDFYIAMLDGIEGDKEKQTMNSFVLVNAFSINTDLFKTTYASISNYWVYVDPTINTPNFANIGEKIPTLFKIQGKLSAQEAEDVQSIMIFFDNFEPIFELKMGNEVYCSSADLGNIALKHKCIGYTSEIGQSENRQINPFLSWNRIEFQLEDFTKDFSILFPVKSIIKQQKNLDDLNINIHISVTKINQQQNFGQLTKIGPRITISEINVQSLTNYTPLDDFIVNPALNTPDTEFSKYDSSDLNSLCDNTSNTCIDQLITSQIKISTKHDNLAEMIINQDPTPHNIYKQIPGKKGSGLTYVADYKFFQDYTIISIDTVIASKNNPCQFFEYLFENQVTDINNVTTYYLQKKFGFFCPNDLQSVNEFVTIQNVIMPKHSGKQINSFMSFSSNIGNLAIQQKNSQTLNFIPQIFPSDILIQPIKKNEKYGIMQFQFVIPIDLTDKFDIIIDGTFHFTMDGTNTDQCALFLRKDETYTNINYNIELASLYHSCGQPKFNTPTQLLYQITNLQGLYQKNTELEIIHYGINVASLGSNENVNIKFYKDYTNLDSIMFEATNINLPFDSSAAVQELIIKDYQHDNQAIGSRSNMQFTIQINNRMLWKKEHIYIDLGDYNSDNNGIKEQIYCFTLDNNGLKQHNWKIIDKTSTLQNIDIEAKQIIFANEIFLTFKCKYIVTPQSNMLDVKVNMSPFPYTGLQVFPTSTTFTLPTFQAISSYPFQHYLSKDFSSPGTNFDLHLYMKTKNELNEQSYIILVFPIYYLPDLSKDLVIECFYKTTSNIYQSVQCFQTDERVLQIQYFKEIIPSNSEFQISIYGVTQPIIKNIAYDFFFQFYSYDKTTQLFEIQQDFITDLVEPLNGNISIEVLDLNSFSLTSNYLMDDKVLFNWQIFIPSLSQTIEAGQKIIINFPYFYEHSLRQQTNLNCTITQPEIFNINYGGNCQVKGLKIIIQIVQNMEPENSFDIKLFNFRNNDITNVMLKLWSIEVTDKQDSKILMKTFTATTNQNIQQKVISQSMKKLRYQTVNGVDIEKLELIRGVCSDWIYIIRDSLEPAYGQSFSLISYDNEIKTYPNEIQVEVGTDSERFRILSNNALGDYSFQIKKQGGGDYYSNLRTLEVIYNNQQVEFEFYQTSFKISKTAKTFRLFFQLKSNPPSYPLVIKFSLANLTQQYGISFVNQVNSINLSVENPFDFLYFKVENSLQFSGQTSINLEMEVLGISAVGYNFSFNTISIIPTDLSSQSNQPPIINIDSTFNTNLYNEQKFIASCPFDGIFYYVLQIYHVDNPQKCLKTQNQIIQMLEDPFYILDTYDAIYPCYEMYDKQSVQENVDINIWYRQLKSKRQYRLQGFCQDFQEKNTELSQVQFQTEDNGGLHAKIVIDFVKELPEIQELKHLLCLFSTNFQIFRLSVTNIDEIYCDQYFQDEGTQQNDLLDQEEDQNQQFQCTEPILYLQPKDQNTQTLTIYVGRNEYIQQNTIHETVLEYTNCVNYREFIQSNIITLPQLLNIHPAQLITDEFPILLNTDQISIYTGFVWIHMQNIQLDRDGIIYVLIDNEDSNPPTQSQLKNMLNEHSQKPIHSEKFFYDTQKHLSYNVTFANLEKGSFYNIYIMYSNELPFEYATFSDIYRYGVNTRFLEQISSQILQLSYKLIVSLIILMLL